MHAKNLYCFHFKIFNINFYIKNNLLLNLSFHKYIKFKNNFSINHIL